MNCDYFKCGDSAELLKEIPGNSIDLTITSPPYDNLRDYNGFSFDFEEIAKQLFRVTKDGGIVVWIVGDATVKGSETGSSFRQALFFKKIGFLLHDTMIWDKGSFTATGTLAVRYASVFEYMFILSKGKPKTFNPLKDRKNKTAGSVKMGTIRNKDGTMKQMSSRGNIVGEYGQRYNIWPIPPCNSNTERTGHPAQFPVRLARDHILSWSNPEDIVLDPFAGSGTTAVASLETGRHYIGFEISQEYIDIAQKRIGCVKA